MIGAQDTAPQLARMVPCAKCKQPTALYTWTATLADVFCRVLRERNEEPLADAEIVWCDDCSRLRRKSIERKVGELYDHAMRVLKNVRAGTLPDDMTRQMLIKHGWGDALNAALASQDRLTGRRKEDSL